MSNINRFAEADDAIIESDEEADYTQMDPGNKKGPLSRWDFETQEDYSSYMSTKEALPKCVQSPHVMSPSVYDLVGICSFDRAAFQYGVKMSDGRKTRRGGPKDEKKELDREWQKIQNIMQKRKNMASSDKAPTMKTPKY